jgi:N,N'-diacetyllegionaminate synthase
MEDGFQIGARQLRRGDAPFIVAEIGVNHNSDLGLAKETIDAAAKVGADAVKFQTFRAEEFMADRSHTYDYEENGRPVRESMYEMFKRLELPEEWHRELQEYSRSQGVEFLSSVADPQSADLLVSLGAPVLKIASEDLINLPLLEYLVSKKVPVILSTGMADQDEIDQAVGILRMGGCTELLLLHCVSLYPTPDEQANLLRMVSLEGRYQTLVGYSDHTRGIEAAIGAVALGACLLEKHFTLDRSLPGPDHALSADPDEMSRLIKGAHRVMRQLGSTELEPAAGEQVARRDFRRSIVAAVEIPQGEQVMLGALRLKRPGTGIPPRDMEKIIGKKVKRSIRIDEQIRWEDVNE